MSGQKRELRVHVTEDLWVQFCEAAIAERLSPSSVMKRLIREYVAQERSGLSDEEFRNL